MSIGELAYQLWQARGCPEGTAEQDWLDAERQLHAKQAPAAAPSKATAPNATGDSRATAASKATDDSLKDTFPASDPPATQRPDTPPANADAKWKAAGLSRKDSSRRSAPKQSSPPKLSK